MMKDELIDDFKKKLYKVATTSEGFESYRKF